MTCCPTFKLKPTRLKVSPRSFYLYFERHSWGRYYSFHQNILAISPKLFPDLYFCFRIFPLNFSMPNIHPVFLKLLLIEWSMISSVQDSSHSNLLWLESWFEFHQQQNFLRSSCVVFVMGVCEPFCACSLEFWLLHDYQLWILSPLFQAFQSRTN